MTDRCDSSGPERFGLKIERPGGNIIIIKVKYVKHIHPSS